MDSDDSVVDGDGELLAPVLAQGGHHLTRGPHDKAKFLDVSDSVRILEDFTNSVLESCPRGVKEDLFFIVDNQANSQRRKDGLHSQFWDDCGSWIGGGPSNRSFYLRGPGNGLKKVVLKNGAFCWERSRNKSTVFIPLVPQPNEGSFLLVAIFILD